LIEKTGKLDTKLSANAVGNSSGKKAEPR